ncbi:MAG: alpha/beta hydrolase [Hyphomicrobiales bacterium]|nr:alpha/beta hydrolase [Hyphomicrobiales bacterium]
MSNTDALFPGFEAHWIGTGAGQIFARSKGKGPAIVLLHGFPQSHVMWHRIADALAENHTVVAMDLRGYGWSAVPHSDHGEVYSKRAMAQDVIAVMSELGHVRFALAGHDRGARVGYRLALDHPGRLEKLALLDIIPTCEVWRGIDAGERPSAHWGFLSQDKPQPEDAIAAEGPDIYFRGLMSQWAQDGELRAFDARAMQAYREAWGNSNRIHAFCEDYRAGATIDREDDETDLAAGRTIDCPVQVLWGDFYLTAGKESPLEVWRRTFAPHASGSRLQSGHFVAEENPQGTLQALQEFLQS